MSEITDCGIYNMDSDAIETSEEELCVGQSVENGARRRRGAIRTRRSSRGRTIRARGRGGRRITVGINRADIAARAREERTTQMQDRINNLPEESISNLLVTLVEKHPSFVFDILEAGSRVRQGGFHPQPENGSPEWCSCSHCREMPSAVERVCCGQIPQNCFSRIRDFDLVVLDELILHVVRTYRQDVLAVPNDTDWNRANRYAAYRQYILWKHGRLGAGNRRIIPICCVWRIRDKFPDSFGQYRGFVHGRLA